MFTGLIEEIGQIKSITTSGNAIRLGITAHKISTGFYADVMPETMNRTALGQQQIGSRVNLERAVRVGDRLGGHMVSGHIDGIGEITAQQQDDNAIWVSIKTSPEILKYIIEKGSIAIDGISLTVAYVDNEIFKVSIIPVTQNDTTLTAKKIGEKVNLECDMTAKYIEKFLFHKKTEEKKDISIDFLKENGFY